MRHRSKIRAGAGALGALLAVAWWTLPAAGAEAATTKPAARRRAGSSAREQEKPQAEPEEAKADTEPEKAGPGEVEGGRGGPRLARRAAASPAKAAPPHGRTARVMPPLPKVPCLHDAVSVERGFGGELQPVVLTSCDGRPAPHAVEQISVLARPMNAPKPTLPATLVRQGPSQREWLPGIKLVHDGLVTRLQRVADHFGPKKLTVVSGYRPSSLGSFHQSARALDFHIDGVSNESLVAFCRTLPDTGCGYYPNSSFVHLDVRPPGTGHVYWIDASGPGESARYVSSWPPPRDPSAKSHVIARPDPSAPLDEHTHPDFQVPLAPWASDAKIDARTTAPLAADKDDVFSP